MDTDPDDGVSLAIDGDDASSSASGSNVQPGRGLRSVIPSFDTAGLGWWLVPMATVGGLLLGIAARSWMRLISTEPEFSWSGTIFIVGGFAVFATGQGIASVGRSRNRGWANIAFRCVGVVTMLPLFLGAGGQMLPTVVGAGLARRTGTWPMPMRLIAGLLAALPVVWVSSTLIHELGVGMRSLIGIAGLLAIYGLVVATASPTFAPREHDLPVTRTAIAMWGIVGLAATVFTLLLAGVG